jgi:uncharacterized protein YndB with AHSA1/START domain
MKPALLLVLCSSVIFAEVVDKSAGGFLVRNTATVSATPAAVYQAIVDHVSEWWEPAHTWSGSSKNLSITAKAGGCFCERLPPDGEVQHMTVIYAAPGKMLRMSGTLGPLQQSGATGAMTLELKPSATGTEIVMTYSVGGYFQGGIQVMAEPVDEVLAAQLAGLKKYLSR